MTTTEVEVHHLSLEELADAACDDDAACNEGANDPAAAEETPRANGGGGDDGGRGLVPAPGVGGGSGGGIDPDGDSPAWRGDDNDRRRPKRHAAATIPLAGESALQEQLREIWRVPTDSPGGTSCLRGCITLEQLEQTLVVMDQRLDGVLQLCTSAVAAYESSEQKLHVLTEDWHQTRAEVERLRSTNESYRKAMANHLRAAEMARLQDQEEAVAARTAAGLRAELTSATKQLHEAAAHTDEAKRKCTLLEDQMHDLRTKFMRVTTEKLQLEREQRHAASLARRSTDTDREELEYYKKKVQELNLRWQRSNAVLAEKDRQLDEYRRQLERTLTGAERLSTAHPHSSLSGKRKTPHP